MEGELTGAFLNLDPSWVREREALRAKTRESPGASDSLEVP
jgi:hypothetical protein